MSAIERFMKIEMIKELSAEEIVDFIDKLEIEAETKIAEKDKEIERLRKLVELTEKDLEDKRRQRNIYRRQCEQWREER